jgi:hypothetical protein
MSTPAWQNRILRQRSWFIVALLSAAVLLYLLDVFWRTDLAIFDAA